MCIDKYVPWAYQDSLFYLFQSLIRSYLNVRLNRHRHICWWWLWCMRAIVRARCVVRVLYNLSVDSAVLGSVVRSINRKANKHTHTVPAKSCVLRCAHTDTHQHTQFEDDRCLPCWPCYSLPSQHILLQDLCCPSLTLYSMSEIKRKKKDRKWEKKEKAAAEKNTCRQHSTKVNDSAALFSPVFIKKQVIDQQWQSLVQLDGEQCEIYSRWQLCAGENVSNRISKETIISEILSHTQINTHTGIVTLCNV